MSSVSALREKATSLQRPANVCTQYRQAYTERSYRNHLGNSVRRPAGRSYHRYRQLAVGAAGQSEKVLVHPDRIEHCIDAGLHHFFFAHLLITLKLIEMPFQQ